MDPHLPPPPALTPTPTRTREDSISGLVRGCWRFTTGRRWVLTLIAVLSLGLFTVSASLPLLTGRLLDTALQRAGTSSRSQEFIDQWLAMSDATRLAVDRAPDGSVDAGSVALGVRSAIAQTIAVRSDDYLDSLFPDGLVYDVSGALGRRLRAGFEDADSPWTALVRQTLADGDLGRPELEMMLESDDDSRLDAADAFTSMVATLSLDDAAARQRDDVRRDEFVSSLVRFGMLVLLVAVLRMSTLRLSLMATYQAARRMQDAVFRQVHDSTLVESGQLSRSSMLSRCTVYIDKVQTAITDLLVKGIPEIASLVLSTAILLSIDLQIGGLMCVLLLIFEVLRRVASPRWSAIVHSSLDDRTALSDIVDEALTHIGTARIGGTEAIQRQQFHERADRVRSGAIRIRTFAESFDFATFSFAQVGLLASVAIIGFARGDISLGAATAIVLYVKTLSSAIGSLPPVLISLHEAAPYMQRLDRVLAAPSRRPVVTMPGEREVTDGCIRMQHVTATSETDGRGCVGVDLVVEPGALHVLVAPRRSSRSTVLAVAAGLESVDHGRVLVDGHDLAHLDWSTLRRTVTMIDAVPHLATASVAENLASLRPAASRSDIEAAIRFVGLHEWCSSLPDGIDTPLGPRGHHVPRLERILINIARAHVGGAPCLVVDDPTSEIDADEAADVWAILRSIARHRAVLVATHRLDAIDGDDVVSVMADDTVVDTGRAHEVFLRSRAWHELWANHRGKGDMREELRSLPTLSHLSESMLERAARRIVTEAFSDAEVIFAVGDPSDRLFTVVRGTVELWDGVRRVAVLSDGDHFGEFDPTVDQSVDAPRPLTARAIGPVLLRSLHRRALVGGTAFVLDGPVDVLVVYRALARQGASTVEQLRTIVTGVDLEQCLVRLAANGSVARIPSADGDRWQILTGSRRGRVVPSVEA